MLEGALILLAGIIIGRLLPERRRAARNPRPACGCSHHHAYHDPETSQCHATVNGKPIHRNQYGNADAWEQVPLRLPPVLGPAPASRGVRPGDRLVTAPGAPVTVTEWGVLLISRSGAELKRYDESTAAWVAEMISGLFPGTRATVVSRQVTDWAPDPAYSFPVPGDRVKCGLRLDLPGKERRHDFVSLGLDTRNCGTAGFLDREILACVRCGTDKAVAA